MKRIALIIIFTLCCTSSATAWSYRDFGVHVFEACRAVSNFGGNPAAVWVVIAATKPQNLAYYTTEPHLWMIDQGQFRQLLVYDGMVLNASHQQTVPLLDLRDHYEFLYMATAREQEWVDFLWGNLEFFDPEYNDDVYVPGPGVLNFE